MQLKVSCPECGTYFHVDRKKIPPESLRAKCSACSAVIPIHSETEDDPPAPRAATDSTAEEASAVSHQVVHSRSSREDLLAMMLVAERERHEMAWGMTRELFRLREVVERQQMVGAKLVETVSHKNTVPLEENSSSTVERLRRGKLELERRAAQPEVTIDTLQQRGFLQRLLGHKR